MRGGSFLLRAIIFSCTGLPSKTEFPNLLEKLELPLPNRTFLFEDFLTEGTYDWNSVQCDSNT